MQLTATKTYDFTTKLSIITLWGTKKTKNKNNNKTTNKQCCYIKYMQSASMERDCMLHFYNITLLGFISTANFVNSKTKQWCNVLKNKHSS